VEVPSVPNIEIKARYPDHQKAKTVLGKLGVKQVTTDLQTDTYFKTRAGRLKLRESSYNGAKLIPYLRPNQTGPKKSEYALLPTESPELCKRLLTEILGIDVVVEKTRELYLIENVRVHLDNVKGLGLFFEFEAVYEDPKDEPAQRAKIEKLLEAFDIRKQDLLQGSYREMISAIREGPSQ
jgi:adenylate cyclase, class 2